MREILIKISEFRQKKRQNWREPSKIKAENSYFGRGDSKGAANEFFLLDSRLCFFFCSPFSLRRRFIRRENWKLKQGCAMQGRKFFAFEIKLGKLESKYRPSEAARERENS